MRTGKVHPYGPWCWYEPGNIIMRDKPLVQQQMQWCDKTFGKDEWHVDITGWYFNGEENRTMFIIAWA